MSGESAECVDLRPHGDALAQDAGERRAVDQGAPQRSLGLEARNDDMALLAP
ncbi:hypothetical protein D9M73_243900 [compost metagenome]